MSDTTRTLKILNLEDNERDTELIRAALESEGIVCDVHRVETEAAFVEALDRACVELLLVDYKLPSFDGMSALAIARKKCPDVPFIFVSGSIGEDLAIEALKNGATDYVLKHKLARLAPSVKRALKEAEVKGERHRAEAALMKSERKYRSLVEATVDGVFQSSADGLFSMINQAGAAMFGYAAPADMIGQRVTDFWADSKYRDAYLERLKREKALKSYPVVGRKRDGTPIYLELSSHVIEDHRGRFAGIEGILRDVTEKRKLEDQLRQAQKMEAIGQLAGGIAHDFNNILNAIIGYASIMEMKLAADDPLRTNAANIMAAAERAAVLTKSLLAFSRKQITNPRIVDLNAVVRNVEKLLLRIIGEDVELKSVLSREPLNVKVDGGQMEQVLMNLATNARDAMPEGGLLMIETGMVAVDDEFVRTHGYGEQGAYALLSVTDTGEGMEGRTLEHIFEPFFTTKEEGKGTGLGLSMVFGIVRQHNGYITCYSEPHGGTSFHLYLPLVTGELSETVSARPSAVQGLPRGSETILVVEDDEMLRLLDRTVLQEFGYHIVEAVNGEDAIAQFRAHTDSIDLVFLDVVMPKLNGRAAYEAIRKIRPDIKALFASGYTANIIHKQGILEEGLDFIMKPILPSELVLKVREILDR